jgi:RecG-like helicase
MDQPGGDAPLQFPAVAEALHRVHMPVETHRHPARWPFWSRLAFDELLAGQLALALVRAQLRRPPATAMPATAICATRSSTRCPMR